MNKNSHGENLYFHEEIALLVLNDERGTVECSIELTTILAGAIISELLLAGCIGIRENKKKELVVKKDRPVDHGLLDECLALIKASKKTRSLQDWITQIAWKKGMWEQIAKKLCDRGILSEEQGKVLFFFKRTIYPERNPVPERKLIERLRHAIFSDAPRVDERTMILLSLLHKTDYLSIPFPCKELNKRKGHMEKIVNGEMVGNVTAEMIQAAQAAVFVAVIMPAITTTIITSN